MVHCLFFNFVEPFDFECCSLAQEKSFVVHYLPCFRQWLITHLLSAFLPFQCLFAEISSLPSPPSLVHFQLPAPLLCASFQFVAYCSGFFKFLFVWGQSDQGAMLVYPRSGWVNTA
jgi:hypothetical protein